MREFGIKLLCRSLPSLMFSVIWAACVVAAATVVVKSVAFVKEVIVARFFGLSTEMDAFVIAFSVSIFVVGIVSSGIQSSLIPWFSKLDKKNPLDRANIINQAFTLTVFVAFIFAFSLFLSAGSIVSIIGNAMPVKARLISVILVKTFSLHLFFVVVNKFFYSVLQQGKRFFTAGLCPIFSPLIVILSIVLFIGDFGIYTLALGAVGGAIVEMIVLFVLLTWLRLMPQFSMPLFTQDLRSLIDQSWVLMIGAALMGSTLLVDRAMASTIGEGAVSALAYGSRVPSLLDSIGATAIATAVLPYFSDMAGRRDWSACKQHLKIYVRGVSLVSLLVMVVLIFLSDDIVKLIFQRGAFTSEDVVLVSGVQQMYLLAIPPFIVGLVAVRMLSALSMNHILTFIAVITVGLNIFFNVIFMHHLGVGGVALSTACTYTIVTIIQLNFVGYVLEKKL